ncbi:MAG: CheY-like chemotaxis protein [Colwellia sp.]|jgi:CheY-like chemotaxis protein
MSNKDVTILLVEDDDVDAMTLKRAFNKLKIANPLVRACDGLEALEILKRGSVPSPFIILLDLQLPRMNGLEFLEVIRKDPKYARNIIFVLTTSKSDEDMILSYKQNIAGYFVKNAASDGFLDIVKLLDAYWKIVHFPSN